MAQKNIKPALKSFSYNLTDYDLGFICSRLHHNYQDDLFQFFEFSTFKAEAAIQEELF